MLTSQSSLSWSRDRYKSQWLEVKTRQIETKTFLTGWVIKCWIKLLTEVLDCSFPKHTRLDVLSEEMPSLSGHVWM